MKTRWIFVVVILITLVTACDLDPAPGSPEEVYFAFWNACESENFAKARSYLTENARRLDDVGGDDVCTEFLHNKLISDYFDFKSDSPDSIEIFESELHGEVANLRWCIDQYSFVSVALVRTGGEWKIELTSKGEVGNPICD